MNEHFSDEAMSIEEEDKRKGYYIQILTNMYSLLQKAKLHRLMISTQGRSLFNISSILR